MTEEQFNELQDGDYIHIKETGLVFLVVERTAENCIKIKSIVGGGISTISVCSNIERFALGCFLNEQPQPEQHSTELKTMLIADAIKAGLKVGAKVWIEVEVMKLAEEYDSEYLSVYTGSTGIFYLPKDKTEILFKPQPFTPKHGEKCRVETTKGNIYNCIAAILEDDYFAVIKNGEVNGVFQPSEIKQFLPL